MRAQGTIVQLRLQACQGCPYDLFQWLPFLVYLDGTSLKPRHIEQIVDQPVQAVGFLSDSLAQLVAGRRVERRVVLQETTGSAGNRRQGRTQIMRYSAEQGVP